MWVVNFRLDFLFCSFLTTYLYLFACIKMTDLDDRYRDLDDSEIKNNLTGTAEALELLRKRMMNNECDVY